jgi:hypothetical protein
MTRQRWMAILLAIVFGALVWGAAYLTGQEAPWLSPVYFALAMAFAGAVSTLPDHRFWWGVALCLWAINPMAGCFYALSTEELAIDLALICIFMTTFQSIFLGLWIPAGLGAYVMHRMLSRSAQPTQ